MNSSLVEYKTVKFIDPALKESWFNIGKAFEEAFKPCLTAFNCIQEQVQEFSDGMQKQWQEFSDGMQKNVREYKKLGLHWIFDVYRPDATSEEKTNALENLYEGLKRILPREKFRKWEICGSIMYAISEDKAKSKRSFVGTCPLWEVPKKLRTRLKAELKRVKLGKKENIREVMVEDTDTVQTEKHTPNVESLVLRKETSTLIIEKIERIRKTDKYRAAIIESRLSGCDLKNISLKYGLNYGYTREINAKLDKTNFISDFFKEFQLF